MAVSLHLAQDPEADALLSADPLALLVGMVLDQQVPLEWAFAGPAELKRRLDGRFDVASMAAMPEEELVAAFARRPALHRYPRSMGARVQALCVLLQDRYDGRADRVWEGVDDAGELLRRLRELPGFGEHKAKIFLALLGKQLGVRPSGWEQRSAPFGDPGSYRSVADIVDERSLDRVRAWKQQAKQEARAQQAAKAEGAKAGAGKRTGGGSKPAAKAKSGATAKPAAAKARSGATAKPAAAKARSGATAKRAGTAKRSATAKAKAAGRGR